MTTVGATLFDLGGVYRPGMVELGVGARVADGRLVTIAELERTVKRLSRRGRPGGPTLRQLLEARAPDRRPTESVMETRLLQALRAHGLPEPVPQYEVWPGGAFIGRVDLAYPEARIAIEYDSDEFHTGRNATGSRPVSPARASSRRVGFPIDVGPVDLRAAVPSRAPRSPKRSATVAPTSFWRHERTA